MTAGRKASLPYILAEPYGPMSKFAFEHPWRIFSSRVAKAAEKEARMCDRKQKEKEKGKKEVI